MTRTKAIIIGCVAFIFVLVPVVACTVIDAQRRYNRFVPTIPDYPNATNVQQLPGDPGGFYIRNLKTTYITPDTTTAILRFYRLELPRHGWEARDRLATSVTLAEYGRYTCPIHFLRIELIPAPPGPTRVTVTVRSEPCR